MGVGSGFAITKDVLVTNRHVLAGASGLEVNTWDGRTPEVAAASVGVLGDLGVAQVEGTLPLVGQLARKEAQAGDQVTVVGYPLGGALRLRQGRVVDRVDGAKFEIPGAVLRLTSKVQPGNSGGPVLNSRGRITAIVFAIEIATNYALGIPADTVLQLADAGGLEGVPECGEG